MKPANDNAKTARLSIGNMRRGDVIFATIAAAVAGVAIVAGLFVTDPPWVVRQQRLDEQRAGSLNMLSDFVGRFYTDNSSLPKSLDDLLKTSTYRAYLGTVDPATGAAYEYAPGDGRSYQLCATFDLDSSSKSLRAGNVWSHKAGHHCFDLHAPTKP